MPVRAAEPRRNAMLRNLRSLVLVVAGAALLSACGLLNAFIPDQEIASGVLGIPAGGTDVTLTAAAEAAGVATAQADATVFVGELTGSASVDALDVPGFVEADTISETVTLGNEVVVRHASATGPFTVTAIQVAGDVTIGNATLPLPGGIGVSGLSLLLSDPTCVADAAEQVCTYGLLSGIPEVDIALSAAQVAAFTNVLKNGGDVSVDATVTMTLAGPGLPAAASITITLETLGATITF
jgi:hypothetical protein